MFSRRFRKNVSDLPKYKKFIGLGSLIAVISVFLPWYQEFDDYLGNELFLGISGPLYLIGFTVLVLSCTIFFFTLLEIQKKKLPRLPFDEWIFHMIAGIGSMYLLILANTIYLHSKFGVNLVTKKVGFGMIIAFVGSLLMIIGAYMQKNSREHSVYTMHEGEGAKKKTSAEKGKNEPLIHIPDRQRMSLKEREPLIKREETIEDKEREQQNLSF